MRKIRKIHILSLVLFGIGVVSTWLSFYATVGYVVIHFIKKFW